MSGRENQHETILESVFRHTPVGVALIDLQGTILEVNPALAQCLGREAGVLVGSDFSALVEPTDAQGFRESLQRLREDDIDTSKRSVVVRDGRGNRRSMSLTVSIVDSTETEAARCIVFVEDVDHRVRVESRLRESEERYRRVVEDQTDLISRSKADGTLLFVNDAYCRHFGVTREGVLGKSFYQFIDEADREFIRCKLESLTPDSPVREAVHRIILADGAPGWQHWIDRGFFDESGSLVELQSVGRDVTEAREASERLKASEERYRLLFRNLQVPAWESDLSGVADGLRERGILQPGMMPSRVSEAAEMFETIGPRIRVRTANEKAFELAGVDSLDAFERWLPRAYSPGSMRRLLHAVEAILLRGDRNITIPITFVSVDGRETEALASYARPGGDGDLRIIVTVQDLTEFERIGRELREREEMMSRVEAAAGAGSWEWDPRTDLIRGSNEFWKILQGKHGGAPERPLQESFRIVHPDDLPLVEEMTRQALDPTSARPASQRQELRIVRPDGSRATVRAQIFYWYGERAVVERAFGTLQDVTAQKHAEADAARHRDEMIRADKMISLGTLVSGVAHEINNPNHSIMLNLPLLRDAWRDATPLLDEFTDAREPVIAGSPWSAMRDEIPDVIRDVEQASERIRNIVDELKGFTVDREPGVKGPASISVIARSALRLLSNIIRKSTHHLHVELDDGLPAIHVAPQQIEQVVVNLVVNACQALENDQEAIRVRTFTDEGHVMVQVIDEGSGITAEDLKKVTDPFFTTKRNTGGTGLGLAVSQRIVEDHGGRLTFESEPGRGTTATLWIPIEQPEVADE